MRIASITLFREGDGVTARLDGFGKRRRSQTVSAKNLGALFGARGDLVKALSKIDEERQAEVAAARDGAGDEGR